MRAFVVLNIGKNGTLVAKLSFKILPMAPLVMQLESMVTFNGTNGTNIPTLAAKNADKIQSEYINSQLSNNPGIWAQGYNHSSS